MTETYIYAIKKVPLMRDVKGGGKSSNPNPNVSFLHVVQILFLIPFQVAEMYVNPSNVLQIIILNTGVKWCPPYQVKACLVPLKRTPTLPDSYRAPLTSLFLSTTSFSQHKWYFLPCSNPDFHSQPTKGKCTRLVRFQNTNLFF